MQRTAIEYLTHTWNPLAMRCTPVSDGCKNCWHLRMANRMSKNPKIEFYNRVAYGGASDPMVKDFESPFRTKKPAVIGVQFMGDLFHHAVTNEQIAATFGVMAACPQHTFMVLTKRPARMADWFRWVVLQDAVCDGVPGSLECAWQILCAVDHDGPIACKYGPSPDTPWPIPNVWMGVSVEDQETADERVPLLLKTPAANRFVSCEPLLGPVDFLECGAFETDYTDFSAGHMEFFVSDIDWVIAGAETGPGARQANLDWFRSLRDQCAAADVPFFFKQDSNGSRELDGRRHEEMK